ncbi:monovalent cation/H(+) antiporter subunit G [Kamptonema cortianum]|nr:monovalent cation/H(+) antiporter subunit G [Kamptonema cortianum]
MITEILGGLVILLGLFFFCVGVLGIFRLPDVHSRLHASGKVATLGLFGVLLGGGVLMPEFFPRLLLLGLFFILSAPAASHVIALIDRSPKAEQPLEELNQPPRRKRRSES